MEMYTTEVAALLAANPIVAEVTEGRIMDMDYRVTAWENAVDYLNNEIDIIDDFGYIRPCLVVDDGGIDRQYIQRRSDTFVIPLTIWTFVPSGRAGMTKLFALRQAIMDATHRQMLPSRKVMMVDKIDGSLSDRDAVFDRIAIRITYLMEDNHGNT